MMTAASSLSRIAAADASGRAFVWHCEEATAGRELQPPLSGLPLAMAISPGDSLLAGSAIRGNSLFGPAMQAPASAGMRNARVRRIRCGTLPMGFDEITSATSGGVSRPHAVVDRAARCYRGRCSIPPADATVRLWPIESAVAGRDARILQGHEQESLGTVSNPSPSLDDGSPARRGWSGPPVGLDQSYAVACRRRPCRSRASPPQRPLCQKPAGSQAGRDFWREERSRYFGSAISTGAAYPAGTSRR